MHLLHIFFFFLMMTKDKYHTRIALSNSYACRLFHTTIVYIICEEKRERMHRMMTNSRKVRRKKQSLKSSNEWNRKSFVDDEVFLSDISSLFTKIHHSEFFEIRFPEKNDEF